MHVLIYVTCLTLFRISAEALGVVDKEAITTTFQQWWMRIRERWAKLQ